jgi:hypothetical protein
MASDTAGARHIWHNVRAYIKVQRKFVSELATKELLRTLVLAVEKQVGVILQKCLQERFLERAITVPPSLTRELEMLSARQSVLEQALRVLDLSLFEEEDLEDLEEADLEEEYVH